MRFDLVDLQLFIAVAETRSITNGAQRRASRAGLGQRADQGAGRSARRCAADARPPRRRADAGRRKPARSRQHRHPQCRGDARRSRLPLPAAPRPPSACSPTRRGFRNICRRRWPPFSASIPTSRSMSRSAKAPTSRTRSPSAPPISGLPPNTRCRTISSGSPSAKTAWCWSPRARMNWRAGGRSISATWWSAISSA